MPNQSRQFTIQVQSVSLSNNDIVTNSVAYLAGNQTETLPEAATLPIEVIATNTGAAANFSGSPTSVGIGANVVFTNLSSGSGITSCLWEFGDTATSTAACQPGNTVNHAYNQPGTYTVKLTVTTGSGPNTRTRVNYITVSGAATYGVQITSPQPAKSGARGTQVIYTVVITNTGTVPDSFTLSLPAGRNLSVGNPVGSPLRLARLRPNSRPTHRSRSSSRLRRRSSPAMWSRSRPPPIVRPAPQTVSRSRLRPWSAGSICLSSCGSTSGLASALSSHQDCGNPHQVAAVFLTTKRLP